MRTIQLAKADDRTQEIESVRIDINGAVPVFTDSGFETAADDFYYEQAYDLFQALLASLPQGVIDRVTVLMLERQCSLLRVQWPPKGVTRCPEKIT